MGVIIYESATLFWPCYLTRYGVIFYESIRDDTQHTIVEEATQHAMNDFSEEQNILSQAHEHPHLEPDSFVPISHDDFMLEAEQLLQRLQASNKADTKGVRDLSNKVVEINKSLLRRLKSLTTQSIASSQEKS